MAIEREEAEFTDYEAQRHRDVLILTDPQIEALHDAFDDLLREAAEALDMDLILLGHVDQDTYTVVAAHRRDPSYSLEPGDTLPILDTYCRQEITWEKPFVLGDALAHPAFRNHPGLTKHGLRAYVGSPIILADATVYGTLCGVDRRSKIVPLAGVERLLALSKTISERIWDHIQAIEEAEADASLPTERRQ